VAARSAQRVPAIKRESCESRGRPEWKLVTEARGVLISHAGVRVNHRGDLDDCGGDLMEFCRRLKEEHAAALEQEIRTGDWKSAHPRQNRVRAATSSRNGPPSLGRYRYAVIERRGVKVHESRPHGAGATAR